MKNLWAYLLILFLIVPPLLISEFYGCAVSGYEFSPDDFTARQFSYRRSPLTKTLRSDRKNEPYELACWSIVNDGHIKIVNSTPQRWDLYSENVQSGDRLASEFDARFLTHFLDDNSDQWTVAYPKKAAILWPEIAKLARSGLYLHIPPIMNKAIPNQYADDDRRSIEQFKSEIGQQLVDAYSMAARISDVNDDGLKNQWLTAAEEFKGWVSDDEL